MSNIISPNSDNKVPKGARNTAIILIIVGLIMTLYPALALSYIVILVGIGLIISGVISLISYNNIKKRGLDLPKVQIFNYVITMILGLVLILSPLFFIKFMVYIIALIILIGSLTQLLNLIRRRMSDFKVPFFLYIFPSLLFAGSIVLLISPMPSVTTITMLFGISVIIYGLVDLYNYYILMRK